MLHNVCEGRPVSPERLVAIRDQLVTSQLYDELHEVEANAYNEEGHQV